MSDLKIERGTPPKAGTYVVYELLAPGFPYPQKQLLLWHEGVWSYSGSDQNYRGEVLGWIGPLPSPTAASLTSSEGPPRDRRQG